MTEQTEDDDGTNRAKTRLEIAREELGFEKTEMAASLGMAYRTYLRAEKGDRPLDESEIANLARIGISLDWYLFERGSPISNDPETSWRSGFERLSDRLNIGKQLKVLAESLRGDHPDTPEVESDNFVLVPRYDIQASAGPGAWNDQEQIVDWLAFSRVWVHNTLRADPSRLVLLTAVGDSMEPTIRAGDLLLIDTGLDHFRDDAIYVIQIAGQLMVKRVQRFFDGGVAVKSDNADAYMEQRLTAEEAAAASVAGRVRWISRMI